MATMEELREAELVRKNEAEAEKARLKEMVLCAQVLLPTQMSRNFGIDSLTMKASELESWVLDEIENSDRKGLEVTVRFMFRTNKWIETLPEANI